jgi:hypothetical protein
MRSRPSFCISRPSALCHPRYLRLVPGISFSNVALASLMNTRLDAFSMLYQPRASVRHVRCRFLPDLLLGSSLFLSAAGTHLTDGFSYYSRVTPLGYVPVVRHRALIWLGRVVLCSRDLWNNKSFCSMRLMQPEPKNSLSLPVILQAGKDCE